MDLGELLDALTTHRQELQNAPKGWRRRTVAILAAGLHFANSRGVTAAISSDGEHCYTQVYDYESGLWICDCPGYSYRGQCKHVGHPPPPLDIEEV